MKDLNSLKYKKNYKTIMYDICHPTYYNMSQLGCTDQIKLTTAFYVYMELCEVKRYWDVEYKYNEKLLLFYLQAKKSKNGAVEVFIPWPAIHNLSLDLISNIQEELETEKFTFVFKEGDTTSVYYSVSSGMIKPIHPDETKILKQNLRKKAKLEREIQRNAANLYERALILNNGETHVHTNMNSLDNEIDDQLMPLELEDIENGQSEICVSQNESKSDLAECEDFTDEKAESKNGNLETEEPTSKSEDLETENFESKSESLETENLENESENIETENLENESENLKTESFQSKSDSVDSENTETKSEHLQTEASYSENNVNNNH